MFPFSFLTLSLIYLFFLFGFNFFGCFLLIYHLLIYFLFSFYFTSASFSSLYYKCYKNYKKQWCWHLQTSWSTRRRSTSLSQTIWTRLSQNFRHTRAINATATTTNHFRLSITFNLTCRMNGNATGCALLILVSFFVTENVPAFYHQISFWTMNVLTTSFHYFLAPFPGLSGFPDFPPRESSLVKELVLSQHWNLEIKSLLLHGETPFSRPLS